ncbi:hypothetical protein C1H46_013712 [Malus baccata]|uniref:Uncharacterized protein n=1 Tax=Malus baccata TaxID=106549 RepID=A0A540MQZ5_MALBA|nr:hypothetical protein C1H46_013712 [Malus baccata]
MNPATPARPPLAPKRDVQLQGPRPSPLKVNKDSVKIKKPPSHPHPHPASTHHPPPPGDGQQLGRYAQHLILLLGDLVDCDAATAIGTALRSPSSPRCPIQEKNHGRSLLSLDKQLPNFKNVGEAEYVKWRAFCWYLILPKNYKLIKKKEARVLDPYNKEEDESLGEIEPMGGGMGLEILETLKKMLKSEIWGHGFIFVDEKFELLRSPFSVNEYNGSWCTDLDSLMSRRSGSLGSNNMIQRL